MKLPGLIDSSSLRVLSVTAREARACFANGGAKSDKKVLATMT